MTIGPTEKEEREIFHGQATKNNLILNFKGPNSNIKKAFNALKKHPNYIVELYYEHVIDHINGHLNVKMHCTDIKKTLAFFKKLTLTEGHYDDAFESIETNKKANNLINYRVIEHYQNDYKGQLFKTNDKKHPIVSDIKDYLTKKDKTYGLYIERTADDILSYTRYGKDKKERLCLHPIDRHFMVASYAKTQEKEAITGTATNQNLTVILESNFPHKVLDYLKNFPEQLIDARFQRPLKIIKTAEVIVNLHTDNLKKTLTMLTNCPNSLIMDVYYNNIYDNERNTIIAQTLLNQFKKQHQNDSFLVRQKETNSQITYNSFLARQEKTNSQKTYDTFPDDINPQTIGHIEQTASALYYRTIDQKTTLIFAKEKETAHGNC